MMSRLSDYLKKCHRDWLRSKQVAVEPAQPTPSVTRSKYWEPDDPFEDFEWQVIRDVAKIVGVKPRDLYMDVTRNDYFEVRQALRTLRRRGMRLRP